MSHSAIKKSIKKAALLSLFYLISLLSASAATEYSISLTDRAQHLVEVQISLPPGSPQQELQLPVWNALYQIRDFAQYINWMRAKDRSGDPLPIHELDKSRWRILNTENGAIVEYQIHLDLPGPFGAQLNPHHAFLNLAQVLVYPVNTRADPVIVRFNRLPPDWRFATSLTLSNDGAFTAENYDRLVDSPVEIGTFKESDFDEGGGYYRVIVDADPADYSMEKIDAMLRKVVSAATTWMGDRPFETYTFLYHFPHGVTEGGMEHAYSTAINVNAGLLSADSDVLASITAHEFFHLWNVKRIRPQTLEPIDYTKENYTRALWFSEGCTSTAADFIELRAGLLDEAQFERGLGAAITELERRPAHLTQSAEESSLDAWLEGYAYYRSPERSISYYNKGELLGLMLDLAVRDASHGQASLREVFQWMNQNYAKKGKFFADSDGVREAAEAVSHADLRWFFTKYVSGTDEIPWDDFLRSVGLRVVEEKSKIADPEFTGSRNFDGPLNVESVNSGSEAARAGLEIGNVILSINGKAPGQESSDQLATLNIGDTLTVKVRGKHGAEHELKWKVGSREEVTYEIKDLENVSAQQHERRVAWLKGEAQATQQASTN
jgi:predicted metalloprotease with PDZ domain